MIKRAITYMNEAIDIIFWLFIFDISTSLDMASLIWDFVGTVFE